MRSYNYLVSNYLHEYEHCDCTKVKIPVIKMSLYSLNLAFELNRITFHTHRIRPNFLRQKSVNYIKIGDELLYKMR